MARIAQGATLIAAASMTITESLFALAVVMVIVGTALSLVQSTHRLLGVQTQTAEIHQRARLLLTRLHHDLINAEVPSVEGVGPVRPAITPGHLLTRDTRGYGAITVMRTLAQHAMAVTTATLQLGDPGVSILPGPSCHPRRTACGLGGHRNVLIFDRNGRSDLLRLAGVTDRFLQVEPLPLRSFGVYGAGASVVPVEVHSYYFDSGRGQIRLSDGWAADVPVVDNVAALSFRYFGSAMQQRGPGGEPGRCGLGDGSGASIPEGQTELSESLLTDGPWCGTHFPFDVDLYRVRRVRVSLRLQASASEYRGPDPRLFARPGQAVDTTWTVPDATFQFDVAPRNTRPWLGPGGPE